MYLSAEKIDDLTLALYGVTPPGGSYKSKIVVQDGHNERISLKQYRYKPIHSQLTIQMTLNALNQKLIELMPTEASSLESTISFKTKDITHHFTFNITKSDCSNSTSQAENSENELGSIFKDNRRYSARLMKK